MKHKSVPCHMITFCCVLADPSQKVSLQMCTPERTLLRPALSGRHRAGSILLVLLKCLMDVEIEGT